MAKSAENRNKEASSSSKHKSIQNIIKQRILNGTYPRGMRLPADSEFYKEFNVNRHTVIRALTELSRQGLIIRKHGSGTYIADALNKPLIKGRTLRLGIFWHDWVTEHGLSNSMSGSITRTVLKEWGIGSVSPDFKTQGQRSPTHAVWSQPERGISVECIGVSSNSSTRHPPLDSICNTNWDGIMTVSIIEEEWLEKVLNLGIPTVLVDFPRATFDKYADQVYFDSHAGYNKAVHYFAKEGYKRIHFVGREMWVPAPSEDMSPSEWKKYKQGKGRAEPDSLLRLSSFRHAMDELRVSVPDTWIHFEKLMDPKSQKSLQDHLLGLPAKERPQAVVCHQAEDAEILIDAFHAQGIKLEGAGASSEPYTGAAIPIYANPQELGIAAADLLISRIKKPDRPFLNVGIRMNFRSD